MGQESKQRIVGIIVLIAVIALLVPFLFTGGAKRSNKLSPNKNEVEIPALTTSTKQEVAAQTPTPAVFSPKPHSKQPQNSTKDATASQQSLLATKPEKSPSSLSEIKPVALPEAEPKPKPILSEPTTTSIVASPPKVKKEATTKRKGTKMFWSVQVGSFLEKARAQKLAKDLQTKGYSVFLQNITTSRGPMVRVLVGQESSKTKALQLAGKLKAKEKIDGRIVRNKQ